MCYMIAAGKKATTDGSVLVARNCDSVSTDALRIVSVPRKTHAQGSMVNIPVSREMPNDATVASGWCARPVSLPQVPETFAYTAAMRIVPGDAMGMVMGGINEYQVSAGASTGGWVKNAIETLTPWPETVIGDFLMTLVLERCKTAREAVEFCGAMTQAYGGRTDNYILADANEAWLFEQYQGTHWAAARVPDDCFVVEANSFRLEEIDPEDPENYLCDPNLVSFAIEHGLWDPSGDEPFRAAEAYGDNARNRPRGDLEQPFYSLHRIWRGISLLSPDQILDPFEPTQRYPLFVPVSRNLSVKDLLEVLKDTYSGTILDEYGMQDQEFPTVVNAQSGRYREAPAWCQSRVIGCPQTITSWVTQGRGNLPDAIGGVFWGGLAATAASPHIPWYSHNTRVPRGFDIGDAGGGAHYQADSAYWLFENIGNLMNLFYQATKDIVRDEWDLFDNALFCQQDEVERSAAAIYAQRPRDAIEYLTDYSCHQAVKAIELGQNMMSSLWTRLALMNNPQTSRVYEPIESWRDQSQTVY
jgi:dipeptidase